MTTPNTQEDDAETIMRRAVEIQRTIKHGLKRDITPQALALLVEATIVVLLQAIDADRNRAAMQRNPPYE